MPCEKKGAGRVHAGGATSLCAPVGGRARDARRDATSRNTASPQWSMAAVFLNMVVNINAQRRNNNCQVIWLGSCSFNGGWV